MFNSRELKKRLINLFPESAYLPIFYYYRKVLGKLDPELVILPRMLAGCRTALDVGANRGIYTFQLSRFCQSVIAFEPQPLCARKIDAYKAHNITVKNMGVSNRDGTLTLYVPCDDNSVALDGLASFRRTKNSSELTVPIVKLDNLQINEVDFIKIDVEGHESEVIDGARKTIQREKPILLIEIEQRHQDRKIEEIFEEISNFGYYGLFLLNGSLVPINLFSYEKFQKPYLANIYDKRYVNNFFFVPNEHAQLLNELASCLKASAASQGGE